MDIMMEARKMAASGGRACDGDIDLLVKVLNRIDDEPAIVMLGANAALMVAIMAIKPKATIWVIEENAQHLNWGLLALRNCGIDDTKAKRLVGLSNRIADVYTGPKIDLLVLDLSFEYAMVTADLQAWQKHLREDNAYVFVHDYDGTTAPYAFPDVRQACLDHFPKGPSWKGGWSGVWWVKGKTK